MNTFDIARLRSLIEYDPLTGKMWWRVKMSNACQAGSPALAARKGSGHLHGFVRGVQLLAHRAAWAMHYGEWPDKFIDHINGHPDDNRIENLRLVTARQNPKNRRPNKGKASQLPHGVSQKANGRFFAQIQSGRKNNHLGYFATSEEAAAAYRKAAIEMGFYENHGRALHSMGPDDQTP